MPYREAPPSSEGPKGPILQSGVPRILGALAVVAAIAGGAAYFLSRPKPPPPIDYGVYGELVRTLEAKLDGDPCDASGAHKLLQLYVGHKNHRGAVDCSEAFLAKCGENDAVRSLGVEGYRGLNDYSGALASANKLVERRKEFLLLRAQIHRQFRKNAEAAADYQALLATSDDVDVLNELVEVLSPCEGAKALRKFNAKKDDAILEQRAELLEKKCH